MGKASVMSSYMKNGIQFAYQGVVGYVYHDPGNTKAIIWCQGGPSMGDDGKDDVFSELSAKHGVSVVVPDYLGSGRSAGQAFTIQRAVQTIAICEEFLVHDKPVVDCWKNTKVQLGVKEVMLFGHSWGATMAALYPRFYPETSIDRIAFLAGVMEYNPQGHERWGGESDADFWQQMMNGWTHYYRGIAESDWKDLVIGGDKTYDPMQNLQALQGKHVQVVHGKQDDVIAYQRSKVYAKKLEEVGVDLELTLTEDDHMGVKSVGLLSKLLSK